MKFCLVLEIFFVINSHIITCEPRTKLKSLKSSQLIEFPNEESYEESSIEDSLDSVLIRTSHLTNVNELLEEFGIFTETRGKGFEEQAKCEPELRSVELEVEEELRDTLYFPKCVRIPRCGGCCGGAAHLLECRATKISHKTIRRANIKFKRLANGRKVPEVKQQPIRVEVHEECGCKCRIESKHCDPVLHRYISDLCKCECLNTNDQIECKLSDNNNDRFWDPIDCQCKCVQTKLCSTGLYFSHDTCRYSYFN